MSDWRVLALGSAFFAGLTAVLAKVGVKDISSNLAALIRTLVILLMLSLVVGLRGDWKNSSALNRTCMTFLVLSGLSAGMSWLCYYKALQRGPVAIVASIDKLSLVFAILASVIFLKEHLNSTQWIGVILMTLGALLISRI